MEKMRDFISLHLKRKGMSIDDLLAKCSISRSMFYRFLKEPFRFSDNQLELISEALEISSNEKSKLYVFKSDYNYVDSMSDEIEAEILGILFSNPYELKTNKIDFEYYDFYKNRTYVLDVDSLVDMLSDHADQVEHSDANCFKCYLTIYNCTSAQKVSSIYQLLSSLKNKFGQKFDTFRIIHYVNYQQDDLLSKLRTLKIHLPLYAILPYYHLVNMDLTAHPWASHVDFFTLKYSNHPNSAASDWRYMVGNIECSRRAYAYSTDNYSLYRFFTCDLDEQNTDFEVNSGIGPLKFNILYKNLSSTTRQILISPELCWSAIIPSTCYNLFERAKNGANCKIIRNIADPDGAFALYSDDQLSEFGANSLKSRFEISEKNETINILTINGLETFTTQNITTDVLAFNETFTKTEVLLQLEFIKSRLGDMASSGQQSFYIINAKLNQPLFRFWIIKGVLLGMFSPENGKPLFAVTRLKDRVLADALYNYVTYEMIDKRGSVNSLLMSDSEAGAFLDTLIAKIS